MSKFPLIRGWAKSKGIYDKGDVKTQYIKLQEEAGELAKAIMNNDYEEFVDAIGDCVVVLTNLAELGNKFFPLQEKISIEGCIDAAWDEIKDRTGKMIDGTFVKSSNLKQRTIVDAKPMHKNGYYNLPCKFGELEKFFDCYDMRIAGTVIVVEDRLWTYARKSNDRNGNCYILLKDLVRMLENRN